MCNFRSITVFPGEPSGPFRLSSRSLQCRLRRKAAELPHFTRDLREKLNADVLGNHGLVFPFPTGFGILEPVHWLLGASRV